MNWDRPPAPYRAGREGTDPGPDQAGYRPFPGDSGADRRGCSRLLALNIHQERDLGGCGQHGPGPGVATRRDRDLNQQVSAPHCARDRDRDAPDRRRGRLCPRVRCELGDGIAIPTDQDQPFEGRRFAGIFTRQPMDTQVERLGALIDRDDEGHRAFRAIDRRLELNVPRVRNARDVPRGKRPHDPTLGQDRPSPSLREYGGCDRGTTRCRTRQRAGPWRRPATVRIDHDQWVCGCLVHRRGRERRQGHDRRGRRPGGRSRANRAHEIGSDHLRCIERQECAALRRFERIDGRTDRGVRADRMRVQMQDQDGWERNLVQGECRELRERIVGGKQNTRFQGLERSVEHARGSRSPSATSRTAIGFNAHSISMVLTLKCHVNLRLFPEWSASSETTDIFGRCNRFDQPATTFYEMSPILSLRILAANGDT